jgi:isoleucyl-tRNA synthetase
VRNVFDDTSTELSASAYVSIHHTDWPQADTDVIDEARIEQMSLARRAASLGLSARSSAGIKVRQPLSKVLVHVKEGWAELEREYVDILADELNVKGFEFVEDADALLSYKVFPVNKLLGPKYGADFPKVRAALNELDPDEVAAKVAAEEPVTLDVDGESVTLDPEEIMVKSEADEGLSTAEDNLLTVAIDTTITPELRAEGLAREIVRRVQAQRKEADFNIEDRITTWYQAEAELAEIFEQWNDYIKDETLTTKLIAGDPPDDAYVESHEVDGQNITIGVRQN